MSRNAETTLGSTAAAGLVPGVSLLGGIKGDMERERTKTEASTLGGLYNQAVDNWNAQMPLHVFN